MKSQFGANVLNAENSQITSRTFKF